MGSGRERRHGISTAMRIYLLSVGGVSLFAILIVILIFAPQRGPAGPEPVPAGEDFPFHRIRIPDEKLELIPAEPMRVRPRRDAWSEEEVERFWIPPEPIIAELLKEENRRVIEDIFDEIP